MKTYLEIIFGLAVLALLFGFVMPWLFSAEDTALVLAGMACLFVVVPLFAWSYFHSYGKKLFETLNKQEKKR